MARLPKVKLRAIPIFPTTVEGGNAIVVTKANGLYSIDFDVSDIIVTGVPEADEDTVYAISWGSVTDDNPGGTFQLVPYSSIQSSSDDLTTLVDLGTTGMVARIAAADFATRTITAGTGIGVTDGDGVADNPTISITDVELLAMAGVTSAADRLFYFTGSGTGSLATFTSFGRSLVDDADAATAQATLGLVIGTNVQAFDAELAAIAGLVSAADSLPYFTGSGTASLATFTTYGRSLVDDVDAATAQATLGLVIGTNVQAFDADLAALAANSTDGLWAHTGAGTGAARTITGTANQVIVTNGDGVSGNPTLSLAGSTTPQGRLTLATAVPVMTTTQSAKTTIYYTPYVGDTLPIYDGTNMVPTTFAELSVLTTDTTKNPAAIGASKVNDWFVWNDAGTLRLSHGPDWTSDTARSAGTALVMVKGILLNNASITNGPAASRGTYVGTTRSNSSSQLDWIIGAAASGGTAGLLGVWNMYNRVLIGSTSQDTASSLYTSNTIRQYGGTATMQCSYVLGLSEDSVLVSIASEFAIAAAIGAFAIVGIGLDSTTAYQFARYRSPTNPAAATAPGPWTQTAVLSQPAIGYHVLSLNQQGDGTNSCEFNNSLKGFITVQIRM